MKKAISFVFAFLILLPACSAKTVNTKRLSQTVDNTISTVEDFEKLRKNSAKNYVINNNIDFGGKTFMTIENFKGNLSAVWAGNMNYTVSNFKIKVSKNDKCAGLFANAKGNIENINFENVTIEIEDGFCGDFGILCGNSIGNIQNVSIENCNIEGSGAGGNIGALAGKSSGLINGCFTSGKINVTASSVLNIGGICGKSENIENCESRCLIDVNSDKSVYYLGGISGCNSNSNNIRFAGSIDATSNSSVFVAELIGKIESSLMDGYANAEFFKVSAANSANNFFAATGDGLVDNCVRRDISNLDKNICSNGEYEMRKAVRDYMYRICTVPWKASENLKIHDGCTNSNGDPRHDQEYKKGEWYFGMPYSHYYSPLERFNYYLNDDFSTKEELNDESFKMNMGNDCVGSIFCALQQISPSPSYATTYDMVLSSGMVAVGDYTGKPGKKTSDICKTNGEKTMYKAYSKLKMGDVLLTVSSYNHGMFVAESPYIYRNSNGDIDPEKSYVMLFEQGVGVSNVNHSHSTCSVKTIHTFSQLFYNSFIPLTVPEYADGKAPDLSFSYNETESTVDGIMQTLIKTNYCIFSVKMVISNDDKTVKSFIQYPNTVYDRRQCRISMVIDKSFFNGLSVGKKYDFSVYINGEGEKNVAYKVKFIK